MSECAVDTDTPISRSCDTAASPPVDACLSLLHDTVVSPLTASVIVSSGRGQQEEVGGTGGEHAESAIVQKVEKWETYLKVLLFGWPTMSEESPSTAEWDWNFFPLLFLPPELLFKILSFLPLKDILRARVNKQLREIEASMMHALRDLEIDCGICFAKEPGACFDASFKLVFYPSEILIEGLKKLWKNCTVNCLHLESNNDGDEVLNFALSHFKAPHLVMWFREHPFIGTHERKRVEQIMEGRVTVDFEEISCINARFMVDIFEVLSDGLDALRGVRLIVDSVIVRKFLCRLGLSVNIDGDFITVNKGLQECLFENGPTQVKLHRQNDDGSVVDHCEIKPFHLISKDPIEIEYVEEMWRDLSSDDESEE